MERTGPGAGSEGRAYVIDISSWINTNATAGVIRSNPSGTPNRLRYEAGL